MYPSQWHREFGDRTLASAHAILPPLLDRFAVASMVEVGCGHAHWSAAARDHGVAKLHCIDGAWNDRSQLLVDPNIFAEHDLARPLALPQRYDLAVCLEVAEHVAEHGAATLVASLVEAAPVVLFGAAIPMQGGHGHINEQWPSYWRDLFAAHGYRPHDLVRPRHWHDREIHYWYRQNCFVYVDESDAAACRNAASADPCPSIALMDAVHPEKFEEVASYEAIAGKRLLQRLPGWALTRLRSKLSGMG